MDHSTYKLIHIAALVLLSLGIGGVVFGRREDGKVPRAAMVVHGLGLVAMLVAGFGMLARLEIHWPWPGWVIGKVVLWVAIGALPMLAKRRRLPAIAWVLLIVGLAAGSAAFAIYKPM